MTTEQVFTQKESAVTYVPHTGLFYVGGVGGEMFDISGRRQNGLHAIARLDSTKLAGFHDGESDTTTGRNYSAKTYDRVNAVEFIDDHMMDRAIGHRNGDHNYQGAVDAISLANLTRVELLTEILDRQYKNVYLINGVRKYPVPKLKLDFDIQTHIKRRGKGALVGKRMKSQVEAPGAVQVSFDMVKYGKLQRAIDTTDEDELAALISPMSIALEDISQIMSQDENLLIQDAMVSNFRQDEATDWGAYSGGASTNNPLDDLTEYLQTIVDNYGHGVMFATEMRTLGKYLSNLRVRGVFPALDRDSDGGLGTLLGFPGVKRITDTDLPYGYAFLWDPRALAYGEGPMTSESFRDAETGVSGHVVRKWVQPVVPSLLATDWTVMMTGAAI